MNQKQVVDNLNQDWIWIKNFHEGDQSAFERIFNKYRTNLINLAFRFLRERQAAEDIAQEVFIRIYEKKVRFDPRAKFSTLLYRMTVNASIDTLRKKKFSSHSLDEPVLNQEGDQRLFMEGFSDSKSTSPVNVLQDAELREFVQREIQKLPEKLRAPIFLHQFEELSYKEVAAILRITEKAVEKRIYHAKEHLRKNLSKYYKSL